MRLCEYGTGLAFVRSDGTPLGERSAAWPSSASRQGRLGRAIRRQDPWRTWEMINREMPVYGPASAEVLGEVVMRGDRVVASVVGAVRIPREREDRWLLAAHEVSARGLSWG